MLMFDASSRDQCEVKRMRTNTPLQALVMMNDPIVLEASRVLAERLMLEPTQAEEKIDKAFRLIICRKATDKERAVLEKFYAEEKERFQNAPASAKSFIAVGEFLHEQVNDVAALAATMQIVHTLYNMDEAITK